MQSSRPFTSHRGQENLAVAGSALSALLSPDELKQLAQVHFARAMRTERGSDRLRMLTFADTLIDVAETKLLLLRYERRLLNQTRV
jgi:hypothetical protein